ncbi:MAG: ABC transporter ATP-binding protein [Novosphingobium sp.]
MAAGSASDIGAPNPFSAREAVAELGIDTSRALPTLRRVVALALHHRRRFTVAIVACLGAALANVAIPPLLGRAVDDAVAIARAQGGVGADAILAPVLVSALLLVLACTVRGALQMAAGYNAEFVGQNVGRDLRLAFFDKLQRLDFAFHDRIHSGDLITRGMLDLEGVRGFLEVGLQRIVQLVLLVTVGGWLLISRDPLLAGVALSFVPVVGVLAGRMGIRLRLAWTRLQERMAVLTRVMEENLQGARLVRAFPARAQQLAAFDEAGDAALAFANQRIRIRAGSMAQINGAYYAAMALVLWLGSQRIAAGALTIGHLAEFLAFMTILQMPVRQISMVMNAGARAVASGTRLFDILDRDPAIADRADAAAMPRPVGELAFENVSFRYGAGEPWAVRHLSFAVAPGRTLGIVGAAGSGKSTIAHLANRFYDATEGAVRLDGHDVRSLRLDQLREAVVLIAQDVFLFDDSIERNIAYARPDAARPEIREAAHVAQLAAHVAALPRGYRTAMGERGSNFSGGQRQRATIARGLLPDSRVLIFDDATSAVDAATEHRLRRALTEATSDKATIIVSHRLSSLMHADEIIVLDGGRIVERGDHAALVAAAGRYAALYGLQTGASSPVAPRQAVRVSA